MTTPLPINEHPSIHNAPKVLLDESIRRVLARMYPDHDTGPQTPPDKKLISLYLTAEGKTMIDWENGYRMGCGINWRVAGYINPNTDTWVTTQTEVLAQY